MSEQNNSNSGGNNHSTFITGLIIGAALTYLFATKNGRLLKDELIKEGTKVLKNLSTELDEKSGEIAEKSDVIKAELDSVKEQVEEVASEVPEHIEKIQKKGRRFFFRKSRTES